MPKNWSDVIVHMIVASVATFVVTMLGFPFIALVLNTLGWPLRERFQRGGTPFRDWSVQKHWEAWAPVLIGWLVVAGAVTYG